MKLHNVRPKLSSTLRGIFQKGIPYEIRNPSGDWSAYFGQYESQRKEWWDTQSCWAYAGNETLEDQLEFLWKTNKFTKEDMDWFNSKGYIDEDGDFYLSRRWIPTLSGVKDNGNDEAEFWRLSAIHGAIPTKMLPYTNVTEYFDLTKITQEMRDLGQEFLKRVDIAYQELGTRWKGYTLDQLRKGLLQSELQIGVPVPQDGSWNREKVKWNGDKEPAHSVALYKVDEQADYFYPLFIYDQYNPMLKQLSRDYYVPLCTMGVVTAKNSQLIGPKLSIGVWQQFVDILRKIGVIISG